MPRTARVSPGSIPVHVLNRGNARIAVFEDEADYQAFENLVARACERLPLRVLGYCLMPNHFHLVLWPFEDGELSRWMQWLMTAHVRRYHRRCGSSGHIWQGRFKAFPIQEDEHLLSVLRYVERNPLRANLVMRAEDWPWSSSYWWCRSQRPQFLSDWPVERPHNWTGFVNQAQTAAELEAVRHSIRRGTPFGTAPWVQRTALRLGLEPTLQPRGRPRQREK